jgi:hypothetical protein
MWRKERRKNRISFVSEMYMAVELTQVIRIQVCSFVITVHKITDI